MSLEEKIKTRQMFCSLNDSVLTLDEYTICKEVSKIDIYQDKNGNYFFGK